MKSKVSASIVLLIALLFSLSLTGCSHNAEHEPVEIHTDEPTAVCIVMRKNANAPEISVARFYDLVYNAAYTYGSVSAVSVEGEPQMLCDYKVNPPDKMVDSTKRRQIAAENTQTILAEIARAVASTPEADTLSALSMSSDILKSKTESVKLLCIDDSFLSTAGLLNFADSNLLEQDPDAIVEQLNERYAIPDFSGIDIMILGMGQTCGSQTALGPAYEHKLESIWKAIFEESDCASLSIDRTPLGNTEPANAFSVSTVTIITDVLTFNIPPEEPDSVLNTQISTLDQHEDEEKTAEEIFREVVRFDEKTIKFVGDSDEFIDTELAVRTLSPIATLLYDNPDVKVILAGTTASVGGDGIDLSLKRAEAVKNVLISAGVNEAQIRCVGLGRTDNCLRVNDLDINGNLIENMAKLNRSVFLFAEDSDTAHKLNIH